MLSSYHRAVIRFTFSGSLLLLATAATAVDPAKFFLSELDRSDAILVGKATSIRQESVEGSTVALVKVAVGETLRGSVAPEIEIVIPRTIIKPGSVMVETGQVDQPVLDIGEEAVLFVTRFPGRENSYSITSGALGKYTVTTTASGDKRANRYLISSPKPGGVPLAGLIDQIRKEMKISAPAPDPAKQGEADSKKPS